MPCAWRTCGPSWGSPPPPSAATSTSWRSPASCGASTAAPSRVDVHPIEARFEAKAAEHAAEKQRIAARALELVDAESTIYLDAGSTCLELARLLAHRSDITVVSNSLPAIVELAGKGPRLVVIGGELRPLSQAIVGPLSTPLLDELYVDRAFMGTFSLSLDAGLTTTDPAEAFTKERALSRAREVVLLVDSSQAGHPFIRPCRSPRPGRRRHHRRRARRGSRNHVRKRRRPRPGRLRRIRCPIPARSTAPTTDRSSSRSPSRRRR